MAWKPWQMDDPLMSGPEVVTIKDKLYRKFQWVRDKFPSLMPQGRTDVYTADTAAAIQEFQFRRGYLDIHPERAGIADAATKVMLGVVAPAAPVPAGSVFYSVTGTWGQWNNGFGWDVGTRLNPEKIYHQPVGYNTGAFLQPDPSHSYIEAKSEGVAELLRLSLPDNRPKVWSGYSMGANVVADALHQWPMGRMAEIRAVVQFGDPSRPPGRTLLGNSPPGHGISEDYPPVWVMDRYYSFSIDGDMYPNAVGLLPQLYDLAVRAEASAEFAMYLFGILVNTMTGGLSSIGGQLLGLIPGANMLGAGSLSGIVGMITGGPVTSTDQPINLLSMMLNIPAIVQTIITALKFLMTNAHGHYGDQPVFDGLTGVDKAVQIVNSLL